MIQLDFAKFDKMIKEMGVMKMDGLLDYMEIIKKPHIQVPFTMV
jgi:hypothetical protein